MLSMRMCDIPSADVDVCVDDLPSSYSFCAHILTLSLSRCRLCVNADVDWDPEKGVYITYTWCVVYTE